MRVALLLFCLATLACSRPREVVLVPGPDDLVSVNGCVISACSYMAAMRSHHVLEPDFWSRVLLVRFTNYAGGHAYCIWETDGVVYAYDRTGGSFPLPVYTRDPRTIALVLAQGMGNSLGARVPVIQSAEFIDTHTASVTEFHLSKR